MSKAQTSIVPMNTQLPSTHSAEFIAEMAQNAKETSAAERPQQSKLSIKGGILSWAGDAVAGNVMPVVVVGSAYINTWYIDQYNPNVVALPRCFSLGMPEFRDGVFKEPKLFAHENVLKHNDYAQEPGMSCVGCPNHEWGSDPQGGRGKACKEKRRIAVIPAAALNSVEDVANAEFATLDIPVMSVANWSNYVNKLSAATGLPYYAVVTDLGVVNDPRSQYKVTFAGVGKISSEELVRAVMKRGPEAEKLLMTPFPTYGTEQEEAAPAKSSGKKTKF